MTDPIDLSVLDAASALRRGDLGQDELAAVPGELEALRAAQRSAKAAPGRALTLLAAPEVVEMLKVEAAAARAALETALGRPLVLEARMDMDRESFEIVVG